MNTILSILHPNVTEESILTIRMRVLGMMLEKIFNWCLMRI